MNGDIEATATLEVGGATTLSSLWVTGNTEMTGTLTLWAARMPTPPSELYVNGNAEVTATLEHTRICVDVESVRWSTADAHT